MNTQFTCTFMDEKRHTTDFVNHMPRIKQGRQISIICLPMVCAFLYYAVHNKTEILIPVFTFVLILLLVILLFYPFLIAKILNKSSKERYGSTSVINRITFDDKIYIEVKEDRIVLEYSQIKKIVDCGSIYALFYNSQNGTYFVKNSCQTATDAQILAFLQEKTGTKLKSAQSKSTIATIVLCVISFVLSALFVCNTFLTGEYVKKGIDLLDNPDYVLLEDTGMDYTVGYKDAYYQIHIDNGLFYDEGSTLILDYTEENYKKELALIDKKMTFLDGPMRDMAESVISYENEFDIGDWQFRVCTDEMYVYPKYFRIIGINDKTKQVAFLDFNGVDLDIPGETMGEFVEEYFAYEFEPTE